MIIIAETEKMSKLKISRRRHLIKAISWNTLAMITTYIVLTELPTRSENEESGGKKERGF